MLALVLALAADLVVLAVRIDQLDIRLSSGPGETWVVVGLDSGLDLPTGADPGPLRDPPDTASARADVIVVVHRTAAGTTALSVPRDLVVTGPDGFATRLATSWGGGQGLVDALCSGLGVPTDHLVMIGLGGFAQLVDSLGGVEVDIREPVRDAYSGLSLDHAGPHRLDGATALALVRSRHPEVLRDGTWVAVPAGSAERTRWAGLVLAAVATRARAEIGNPLALQRLAWRTTGVLTTDTDTSLWDLFSVARNLPAVRPLPVQTRSGIIALPTAETRSTLRDAGFTTCRPG